MFDVKYKIFKVCWVRRNVNKILQSSFATCRIACRIVAVPPIYLLCYKPHISWCIWFWITYQFIARIYQGKKLDFAHFLCNMQGWLTYCSKTVYLLLCRKPHIRLCICFLIKQLQEFILDLQPFGEISFHQHHSCCVISAIVAMYPEVKFSRSILNALQKYPF